MFGSAGLGKSLARMAHTIARRPLGKPECPRHAITLPVEEDPLEFQQSQGIRPRCRTPSPSDLPHCLRRPPRRPRGREGVELDLEAHPGHRRDGLEGAAPC